LACIKQNGIVAGAESALRTKEASETAFAIITASANKPCGVHTKNTGQTLRLMVIEEIPRSQNSNAKKQGKKKAS